MISSVTSMKQVALIASAALSLSTASAGVSTYSLDASKSEVSAKVSFFGLASKTARFPAMNGSIRLDPAAPRAIDLRVELDARKLTAPDETTLRRLKSEKFFWVERYPTVMFEGTSMVLAGDREGTVSGTITARGVTRETTLDVRFDRPVREIVGNAPVRIEAETKIDRRDFGMTSYGLIVGKTVKIRIDAHMVSSA